MSTATCRKRKLEDPSSTFLKYCEAFLETLFTISQALIFGPIALIPIIAFVLKLAILRFLVTSFAKRFHKGKFVKTLDLVDTLFANVDDVYRSPFNTVVTASVLQGTPDIEKVRKVYQQKILQKKDERNGEKSYPELMQSLDYFCGFPFWVEAREHEILEKCVRICPPPGYDLFSIKEEEGGTWTSASVTTFLKKMSFLPFLKGMPLWELVILPNYIPNPALNEGIDPNEPHFICVWRIHHCVADGISAMSLFDNFDESPKPASPKMERNRDQSFLRKVQTTIRLAIFGPLELSRYYFRQASSSPPNTLFGEMPNRCSTLRREERLSAAHLGLTNMNDINDIKLKYGVRGMSVIICAFLRSLRQTMFSDTSGPIPSVVQFIMPLPTSAQGGKLRNQFTFGTMFVPFDEQDPVLQLLEINKVFEQYSSSILPTMNALGMSLGGLVPQSWARFIRKPTVGTMETIAISSVPGPKKIETAFGYPFKHLSICAGLVIDQRCLMIYFISFGGKVCIVDVADKQVIPTDEIAQDIMNWFPVELETLKLCKHD